MVAGNINSEFENVKLISSVRFHFNDFNFVLGVSYITIFLIINSPVAKKKQKKRIKALRQGKLSSALKSAQQAIIGALLLITRLFDCD